MQSPAPVPYALQSAERALVATILRIRTLSKLHPKHAYKLNCIDFALHDIIEGELSRADQEESTS